MTDPKTIPPCPNCGTTRWDYYEQAQGERYSRLDEGTIKDGTDIEWGSWDMEDAIYETWRCENGHEAGVIIEELLNKLAGLSA